MTSHRQVGGEYLIISPVKDEEQYIERTIRSIIKQTIQPVTWIIVDDGSSDRTPDIIDSYARRCDWINTVRVERGAERLLGSAEIQAFQHGYRLCRHHKVEFIVKLDGDLELPIDYFEQVLDEFRRSQRLGIASGTYLETRDGQWHPVSMPAYHAAGAAKMIRIECLNDIGGFPLGRGWDTADEIKAQTKGWETRHFPHIQFHHLRPEGSASGRLRTHMLHGEVFYACGGRPLFLCAKVINRALVGQPPLIGGLMLLIGYLRAVLMKWPKLVTTKEAEFYNRVLHDRLDSSFRTIVDVRKWRHKTSVGV